MGALDFFEIPTGLTTIVSSAALAFVMGRAFTNVRGITPTPSFFVARMTRPSGSAEPVSKPFAANSTGTFSADRNAVKLRLLP